MKCTYTKSNNKQCQAYATKKSKLCFVHDPENQEKRLVAAAKGGALSKKNQYHLEPISINSPSHIVNILEETINGVRSGIISSNTANTLAYICSHALKAMEASNLDSRLEVVESILLERRRKSKI
jgi:hypothetical protein